MLHVDFTVQTPIVEFLTGQVDGVRLVFTTANPFDEVVRLFCNGLLLREGDDYTYTAPHTITFAYPPEVHPLDGKWIIRAELL